MDVLLYYTLAGGDGVVLAAEGMFWHAITPCVCPCLVVPCLAC